MTTGQHRTSDISKGQDLAQPDTTQAREAEFWDKVVDRADDDDAGLIVGAGDLFDPTMPWLGHMDMPVFMGALFDHVRAGPGLRVLDLGCGKGFLSVALAHRGAEVTGIDISPRSIESCRRRADLSGVADRVRFEVMDCETLDFPDDSFDAVCGSFVLHHLDLAKVASEVSRVLRPQGRSAFIETMGLNRLLMLARSSLPGRYGIEKASSADEYPLDRARIETLRRNFDGRVDAVFPQLVFLRMGAYVERLNTATTRRVARGLDHAMARVGALRSLSYYGLVTMDGHAGPQ